MVVDEEKTQNTYQAHIFVFHFCLLPHTVWQYSLSTMDWSVSGLANQIAAFFDWTVVDSHLVIIIVRQPSLIIVIDR